MLRFEVFQYFVTPLQSFKINFKPFRSSNLQNKVDVINSHEIMNHS